MLLSRIMLVDTLQDMFRGLRLRLVTIWTYEDGYLHLSYQIQSGSSETVPPSETRGRFTELLQDDFTSRATFTFTHAPPAPRPQPSKGLSTPPSCFLSSSPRAVPTQLVTST